MLLSCIFGKRSLLEHELRSSINAFLNENCVVKVPEGAFVTQSLTRYKKSGFKRWSLCPSSSLRPLCHGVHESDVCIAVVADNRREW
ncbi:hypothetical protein V5799_030679 [Amblyomma americanum]|uniref:Uncharacterized protein n=1 Tax=Amblyomma americanum TaxID=6943 RepID=A0AAQ4EMI5_AMBAM